MDSGHTGVEFINRITESDSMNVMSFEGLDNGQWHSGIAVVDINNDSYPDVVLAGNGHTNDINTGYFDANKGIVLMSKDNRPLLDLKTSSQSGLMLHGMVESLLYLDGKTPYVIAGMNRDRALVYSIGPEK